MLKNRIENYLNERYNINVHLQKIIKHISLDNSSPLIIDDSNFNWYIEDDYLIIVDDENDEYTYTISSLESLGIDLYLGEEDGFTYVMAYPEDDWRDSFIFILDNKKMLANG